MKPIRNFPQFTHFASLPFIQQEQRQIIHKIQSNIKDIIQPVYGQKCFEESNHKLAHLTLSMLTLNRQEMRNKTCQVMTSLHSSIQQLMMNAKLTFKDIGYFSKQNNKTKKKEVTLIYLQLEKNEQWLKLIKLQDIYIRAMLKSQVIANNQLKQMRISYHHNQNLFKNQQFHLTLFRVQNVVQDEEFINIFKQIKQIYKPLQFDCHHFDISTRGTYDQTSFYQPLYRIELDSKNQPK